MGFSQENIANCLIVYFNFAYYLLFSPFRFIPSSHKVTPICWKIQKCTIQSIGYTTMGFLGTFATLAECINIVSEAKAKGRDPVVYFSFLACLFTAILHLRMHKMLWFERHKFLDIINFISSKPKIFARQFKQTIWQNKCIWQIICFLYLMEISFEFYFFLELHLKDSNLILKRLVRRAHKAFFLQETRHPNFEDKVPVSDYFLVILFILVWVNQYLIDRFLYLGLLCSSFILWTASFSFRESLQIGNIMLGNQEVLNLTQKSSLKNKLILEHYEAVKELCQLVSSEFGKLFTWYIGNGIVASSNNIDSLVFGDVFVTRVAISLLLTSSIFTLVLSAEVVMNV